MPWPYHGEKGHSLPLDFELSHVTCFDQWEVDGHDVNRALNWDCMVDLDSLNSRSPMYVPQKQSGLSWKGHPSPQKSHLLGQVRLQIISIVTVSKPAQQTELHGFILSKFIISQDHSNLTSEAVWASNPLAFHIPACNQWIL